MTNENTASFTHDDYEITQRDVLYKGIFQLIRYHIKQKTFEGKWIGPYTREVFERKSAVAVLPYDPVLDRVVLIEQFRAGAITNPESPWLIEIVAGLLDKGDGPKETAIREANEEAGCKMTDIYPICEYFVSPGGSNEYLNLFCGRVDASDIDGVHGLANEHEDIRAFTVSLDDALKMIQEGSIKTPPAIIALFWLQLNREWLRQLWQTK